MGIGCPRTSGSRCPTLRGGAEIYRFGCVTILEYAGEGLWSFQEDIYNPNDATQMMERWVAAGGELVG